MRKVLYAFAVLVPIAAVAVAATIGIGVLRVSGAHASGRSTVHRGTATCTPTGFIRDGINLTAAMINPASTVSGVVDATGCNIGVYYSSGTGNVLNAEIFGANYFGVVNNGANVSVSQSNIHDIGETPLNGDQHGVAVYWAFNSGARGTVANNLIYRYQKGGIVISGTPDNATVTGNEVLGLGPVNFIAQNGIEIGSGAVATVTSNYVTGNSYTGAAQASSGGIIVYGGSCYGLPLTVATQISNNTAIANDVGLWISDIDVDPNNPDNCIPTATATNVSVTNNTAVDNAVTNTTGDIVGAYQAGISDQGNGDAIGNDFICGQGYNANYNPPPYTLPIDVTATNNVTLYNDTECAAISAAHVKMSAASLAHLGHPARHARPEVVK